MRGIAADSLGLFESSGKTSWKENVVGIVDMTGGFFSISSLVLTSKISSITFLIMEGS